MKNGYLGSFLFLFFVCRLGVAQEIKLKKKDLQIDGVVLLVGDPANLRTDFINDELLFENAMMKWQGLHPESKRFQRLKHTSVMNHGIRGIKRNDVELTEENLSKTFQYFENHFENNLEKNDTLWIEIFAHGIPWGFQAKAPPKGILVPYESLFIEIASHFQNKNIIIHSTSCFSGSLILAALNSKVLKNFKGTLKIISDSHPELPVFGIPVEKTFFTVTRATFPSYYFFSALAGQFPDGENIDLSDFEGTTHLEKAFHYMNSIPGNGLAAEEFPVRGSFSLLPSLGSPYEDRVHFPQFFTLGESDFDFYPVKRPLNEYFQNEQSWIVEDLKSPDQLGQVSKLAAQLFKIIYNEDSQFLKKFEMPLMNPDDITDPGLKKAMDDLNESLKKLEGLMPPKSKWLFSN